MLPLLIDWAKRYGLRFIVPLLAGAGLVWFIVDGRAAPGEPIKLLWGLAEYTKENPPEFEAARIQMEFAPPRRIAAAGSASATNAALRSFRIQEKLRDLGSLETGKSLEEMPIATYGFVSGLRLDPKVKRLVAQSNVMGVGTPPGTKFEVQKNPTGELSVVAYASASDSARALGTPVARRDITLFPKPWSGACDLLIIPERAFASVATRTIQSGRSEMVVVDAVLGSTGID